MYLVGKSCLILASQLIKYHSKLSSNQVEELHFKRWSRYCLLFDHIIGSPFAFVTEPSAIVHFCYPFVLLICVVMFPNHTSHGNWDVRHARQFMDSKREIYPVDNRGDNRGKVIGNGKFNKA